MEEQHLSVPRSARYHTLGEAATAKHIWIVLHGYAQLARYFLRPFAGLEAEKLIAAPEGLSRFYSDSGHSRVGATWMTREDREHEIADQAGYLDRLAEQLRKQCPPGTPLSVLGFSQGVATACRWAVSTGTPIDRLVLWGGSIPPELDATTLATAWHSIRVMLVHGEQDPILDKEVHAKNRARLREAGLIFEPIQFDGGHALDRTVLGRVL